LDPGFVGSDLAKSNGFLRAIKICNMTSFGGELKSSAPCHEILRHIKDPLRYDRDTDRQNSATISHPVFPRVTAKCCNQSRELRRMNQGIIRTQMGSTVDLKMVTAPWDALYDTSL
jgi:hypothetical protein